MQIIDGNHQRKRLQFAVCGSWKTKNETMDTYG